MHQPYYRDLVSGDCSMPWVRLHATKDYLDMVKILEPFPSIHQTFNIVPSLLDQLEEYLPPANRSDAFLDCSRTPAARLSGQEQQFILRWFFLANIERMIKPYPRYHDLLAKRGLHVREEDWPAIQQRFSVQDYLDLQVWFNLAWIDPWLRRQDPRLAALEAKGGHFTEADKGYLLEQQLALIGRIIPAYRDAAARGAIELSASPFYHPIMPLLCDLREAHRALPQLALPRTEFRHPEDARWQLETGLRRHQETFGTRPNGVWPPEGSVSEAFVALACASKIRWIAADEEILWRTTQGAPSPSRLYRPHLLRRKEGELAIVFRDRELSDLIGFTYSQWEPQQAVADFLTRLGKIYQQTRSQGPALVSIILDGENAWESYADDGHEFLASLYGALANDDRFRCVTVSEFLRQHPVAQTESLPALFSGSWIEGNFATWVGHPEKNAAWEHLSRAREALAALSREDAAYAKAWKSLGIAEGSDWMWWFGDTHFSAQAEEFDRLFRAHLANSYRLAHLEPPEELKIPIRKRGRASVSSEPTGLLHPTIDGRETSYYEWLYAGWIDLTHQYSAIQRTVQCLRSLRYGFDDTQLYLRVDLNRSGLPTIPSWSIDLALSHGVRIRIAPDAASVAAHMTSSSADAPPGLPAALPSALGRVLELAVPLTHLELTPGEKVQLTLTLQQGREVLERYPAQGAFPLSMSASDVEARMWSA